MAWSVLQSASVAATASTATSVSKAFTTANLSSGTMVIAAFSAAAGSASAPTTPTATCGGTSMLLIAQATANGGVGSQVLVALFALNTPAGQVGTKPTVQGSWTNVATTSMVIQEVSGLAVGATLGALVDGTPATHTNTSGTSPATTGAYSSTASNEYLVMVYGDDGGPVTWGATSTGYTQDANSVNANSHADLLISYKNSTNGSESASTTLSGSIPAYATLFAAFQLLTTVVALTTPNIALAAPLPTPSGGATVALTTPNIALAAPLPAPLGSEAAIISWGATYSRNPVGFVAEAPILVPTAIPVTNTAGFWLFAVVSWRQDAGTAGYLQFPSTISVSDDAANFWIPVYAGVPATAASTTPGTGIMRISIWMAPAARQAEFVFVSPTGYQAGMTARIFEFKGVCPWYQVQIVGESFTNQGTSVSQALTVPVNVFALGAVAWDNNSASVSVTATGWTPQTTDAASNGTNHTGDVTQFPYANVGTGGTLTLSASSATTMDWAAVIVVVSGVTDARAYPYGTPVLENWPIVVTEIGAGPVLNADPVFTHGTTFWSGNSGDQLAVVSSPQWTPSPVNYQVAQFGSLRLTPSGTAGFAFAQSETEPVTPSMPYTATAWVYSPAGFGGGAGGAFVALAWSTAGHAPVSTASSATVQLQPGEWTQLFLGPSFPPPTAAFARAVVQLTGTTVPSTAVIYIAYCAFSVADAYEGTPPDQIGWSDISPRAFTQGAISTTRGIQYEQQSLEAGTLTVYLDNHDGAFTLGNVLSPYYPNVGDTDVPIRVRTVWPGSLTPYTVLFSGFTDDARYGVDSATYYGYVQVQASDAWSRLTQQMLGLAQNEALTDGPVAFISCNQTGGNTVQTGSFTAPAQSILSSNSQLPETLSPTPPSANFSGGAIAVPGASGLSCWQSTGSQPYSALIGFCLAWLPSAAMVTSQGITIEFWWSPVDDFSSQPSGNVITICQALSGENAPLWLLYSNSATPSQNYLSFMQMETFTSAGVGTVHQVGTAIPVYADANVAGASYYISITFTTTTLTVVVNPGGINGTLTETISLSGLSFAAECTGFTFGGGLAEQAGFGDTAIADIAVYTSTIPAARTYAHYQAGLTAFLSESDTWRLARIAGYAGFVPVLGMRGSDLAIPPAADVDVLTAATDTNTQVASAYFTNVAASTLAAMFINGPGTLIYRRRQEWYNRPIAQYVLGESDNQLLSQNLNPLNIYNSVSGWAGSNNATISTGGAVPAAGAEFVPFSALFVGDGITASPGIAASNAAATTVTPGAWYSAGAWVYCPQGWVSGVSISIQWHTSGGGLISSVTSPLLSLAPGSVGWVTAAPARAPATAAFGNPVITAAGIPAPSVQFSVAGVVFSQVSVDYAGGPNVAVPEAPYSAGFQMSSDRAQLFNYAILTQYGTNLVSSFSGTSVLFTPSSGVIVLVSNTPSIIARGQIPYTATVYLDNTTQAAPYALNEGSIDDVGGWITQTLGAPLFRPDKGTLTPAATPASLTTAVQAEIGDTILFRRRALGAPEVQILTYLSKLTHNIDIASGTWTTEMELSPFPGGTILSCDDVVHGVLTGQNLLGW